MNLNYRPKRQCSLPSMGVIAKLATKAWSSYFFLPARCKGAGFNQPLASFARNTTLAEQSGRRGVHKVTSSQHLSREQMLLIPEHKCTAPWLARLQVETCSTAIEKQAGIWAARGARLLRPPTSPPRPACAAHWSSPAPGPQSHLPGTADGRSPGRLSDEVSASGAAASDFPDEAVSAMSLGKLPLSFLPAPVWDGPREGQGG